MANDKLINMINVAAKHITKQSRQGAGNYFVGNSRLSDMIHSYEKREERKKKIKKLLSNINERTKNKS